MAHEDLQKLFRGRLVKKRYRLVELIGAGGMGNVWTCEDTLRQGELVAIKFPRADADPLKRMDIIKRFVREVEMHMQYQHPRIVTPLDPGQDEFGIPFLVMELLIGKTLHEEFLECQARKPTSGSYRSVYAFYDICLMGIQVSEVLGFLHGKGIIYRDLKPENIMVVRGTNGQPSFRMLDFGLARREDGTNQQTQYGEIVGTPYYMAPELLQPCTEDGTGTAWKAGPHSDVFALAKLLYEAVTGTVPGKESSDASPSSGSNSSVPSSPHGLLIDLMNLEKPPPDPALLVPGMDPELRKLILEGMERKPWKRIRTAMEMHDRLRAIATRARRPLSSMPPPPPQRAASSDPPASQRMFPSEQPLLSDASVASHAPPPPSRDRANPRSPIPVRSITPPSLPPPGAYAPLPPKPSVLSDRNETSDMPSSRPPVAMHVETDPVFGRATVTKSGGLSVVQWVALCATVAVVLAFGATYALFRAPIMKSGPVYPSAPNVVRTAEQMATDGARAATASVQGVPEIGTADMHSPAVAPPVKTAEAPPGPVPIALDPIAPPDVADLLRQGRMIAYGRAADCKSALVFFRQGLKDAPNHPALLRETIRCLRKTRGDPTEILRFQDRLRNAP